MRGNVDVLDVAQVPSEIGWAAFSITCSEASNVSQHAMKWFLSVCECGWTEVSAVFLLSSIFSACINNKASLLIYLKGPPICAWLLRACPTVLEHWGKDCALHHKAESEAAREPLKREKKTSQICVWIYPYWVTVYMWQSANHSDRKWQCKAKWQTGISFHVQENRQVLINPTALYYSAGRKEEKLLIREK